MYVGFSGRPALQLLPYLLALSSRPGRGPLGEKGGRVYTVSKSRSGTGRERVRALRGLPVLSVTVAPVLGSPISLTVSGKHSAVKSSGPRDPLLSTLAASLAYPCGEAGVEVGREGKPFGQAAVSVAQASLA